MVGAVVVSDGEVIADGWHQRYGGPHAEVEALRAAGDRAQGSTMYVTFEPCTHHGKTSPCADALIAAGIRRVVIAARDPNPLAKGGVERLRQAGLQVEVGAEGAAACEMNAAFFNSFASDRPWVTLKLAMSADRAIADPTGQRRWITGPESRAEGHRMRAGTDAVAVGIGTVLADDPQLTVRDAPAPRRQPTRVIFDSDLRTPLTAAVVREARAVPTIIVAAREGPNADGLRASGVDILMAGNLPDALKALRARDVRALLVEGGARLAGSFLRENVVDRVAIFQAPVTLGTDAVKAFAHAPHGTENWLKTLPVVDRRTFGEDTLITYAVREVPCLQA